MTNGHGSQKDNSCFGEGEANAENNFSYIVGVDLGRGTHGMWEWRKHSDAATATSAIHFDHTRISERSCWWIATVCRQHDWQP